MASNYGVGASLGKMGLVGQGIKQEQESTAMLGKAADEEQRRNLANEKLERERKQQNQTLGATAGALAGALAGAEYGSAIGPWGTVIGGIVGGLAGSLF